MTSQWDATVSVGLPIFAFVALVCIIAIRLALWFAEDREEAFLLSMIPGAGLLIAGFIAAAVYWPYDSQYFQYVPRSGVVAETDSRLISDGKAMSQRIVVTYADGQQYGCDDTRCATLKKGDHVTLMCEKEYQFTGTEGWSCAWGKRSPA